MPGVPGVPGDGGVSGVKGGTGVSGLPGVVEEGPKGGTGKKGGKKGGLPFATSGEAPRRGKLLGTGPSAPGGMSRTAGGISGKGFSFGLSAGDGRSRSVESTRSCGPFVLVRCKAAERLPGERCANNERGSFSAPVIFFTIALLMACPPGSVTATKVSASSTGARYSARLEEMPGANKRRSFDGWRPKKGFQRNDKMLKIFHSTQRVKGTPGLIS